MLTKKIVDALKERYKKIHPLAFQRSLDHAKSDVDLFDILDTFPKTFPISWDKKEHRWVTISDLFLSRNFKVKE